MTEQHDTERVALGLLASADAPSIAVAPSARERAIAVTARAIEARAARRRRNVVVAWLASVASVAAIVSIVFVRYRKPPASPTSTTTTIAAASVVGDVRLHHAGQDVALSSASKLAEGDHVVTQVDSRAELALSTGTTIGVAASGELELSSLEAQQIFSVLAGSAHFQVAKLRPGERFLVRTADAEVEVHGTTFDVARLPDDWTCPDGVRTRVMVSEGIVSVRHGGIESRLEPGATWPLGCKQALSALEAAPLPSATVVIADASASSSAGGQIAKSTASPPPKSDLEAQNDLLARALAAKRSGARAAALAAYESFLAKYPGTALAEVATVERMRLLSGSSAVQAANAYLARYPNGFARDEAKKLATGAK